MNVEVMANTFKKFLSSADVEKVQFSGDRGSYEVEVLAKGSDAREVLEKMAAAFKKEASPEEGKTKSKLSPSKYFGPMMRLKNTIKSIFKSHDRKSTEEVAKRRIAPLLAELGLDHVDELKALVLRDIHKARLTTKEESASLGYILTGRKQFALVIERPEHEPFIVDIFANISSIGSSEDEEYSIGYKVRSEKGKAARIPMLIFKKEQLSQYGLVEFFEALKSKLD